MKFFNPKPPRAAEVREVPLGKACEGALLLVYLLLWPQCDLSGGLLAEVSEPAVAALKAELQRRWLNRGAPIAIELPARLPALCIEVAVHVFRNVAELLRQQESRARSAGGVLCTISSGCSLFGAVRCATRCAGGWRLAGVICRLSSNRSRPLSAICARDAEFLSDKVSVRFSSLRHHRGPGQTRGGAACGEDGVVESEVGNQK